LGGYFGDENTGAVVSADDGSAFIHAWDLPLQAPWIPPQGLTVGDVETGAANPADTSWLIERPVTPPMLAPQLPPLGWFTGDIDSGVAIAFSFFGVAFKNEKTTWNKGNRSTMLAVNDPVTIPVGGGKDKTDRYTANQTLTPANEIVLGDTDGGAFTITLPAGIDELHYKISNTGSSVNALTITPNGSDLLAGVNENFELLDGETLDITFETTEGWIA
jgi:hypothetical protein